jgi:hypothetical protein
LELEHAKQLNRYCNYKMFGGKKDKKDKEEEKKRKEEEKRLKEEAKKVHFRKF